MPMLQSRGRKFSKLKPFRSPPVHEKPVLETNNLSPDEKVKRVKIFLLDV